MRACACVRVCWYTMTSTISHPVEASKLMLSMSMKRVPYSAKRLVKRALLARKEAKCNSSRAWGRRGQGNLVDLSGRLSEKMSQVKLACVHNGGFYLVEIYTHSPLL